MESLSEIKNILVSWSESSYISDELGCNDEGDINKFVDAVYLDDLIRTAATKQRIPMGYDKTVLTVFLNDGDWWCKEYKFCLLPGMNLLDLLKH